MVSAPDVRVSVQSIKINPMRFHYEKLSAVMCSALCLLAAAVQPTHLAAQSPADTNIVVQVPVPNHVIFSERVEIKATLVDSTHSWSEFHLTPLAPWAMEQEWSFDPSLPRLIQGSLRATEDQASELLLDLALPSPLARQADGGNLVILEVVEDYRSVLGDSVPTFGPNPCLDFLSGTVPHAYQTLRIYDASGNA